MGSYVYCQYSIAMRKVTMYVDSYMQRDTIRRKKLSDPKNLKEKENVKLITLAYGLYRSTPTDSSAEGGRVVNQST